MRNDRNHSSIFWDRLEVPLGRGKDKTDSSLAKIDPIARADLGVGPGGLRPPFVVYQTFPHYMFNIGSRHLLNCISENFNLENFSGGACPRNSLEKCAVFNSSPQGGLIRQISKFLATAPPSSFLVTVQ